MHSIARFYAHLYHTVPEQLGPKTTKAAVLASLVTTAALTVLYPLSTSLAVAIFLAGGVASYRSGCRLLPAGDPLSRSKISLVFRTVLFPEEKRASILQFLNLASPKTSSTDKEKILSFVANNIPFAQRDKFYNEVKANLSIKREDIRHYLADILSCIWKQKDRPAFWDQAAHLRAAFNFQEEHHVKEALCILANQPADDRRYFIIDAKKLQPFLPAAEGNLKQRFALDLLSILNTMSHLERPSFIDQITPLLPQDSPHRIVYLDLIKALINVEEAKRGAFAEQFFRWHEVSGDKLTQFAASDEPSVKEFLNSSFFKETGEDYVDYLLKTRAARREVLARAPLPHNLAPLNNLLAE